MKKYSTLVAASVTAVLLLSGCSEDKNSGEACKYDVTMALDQGNYDTVIATTNTCEGLTQEEKNLNMGAAWFGKAGFDAPSLINKLSEEDAGGESDFVTQMAAGASGTDLSYMTMAKFYYSNVATVAQCSVATVGLLTQNQESACLSLALVAVAKAGVSMNLLTGGISLEREWQSGLGGIPE